MSLKSHLDVAALAALCQEIQMPEQVSRQVAEAAAQYPFDKVEGWYNGLFSAETGAASSDAIRQALLPDDPDGILLLTVMLAAALETGERCQEKGISHNIWVDTMKCFSRFVGEHLESFGRYGFDRSFWTWRQLSGLLYRIGSLEYEMRTLSSSLEVQGEQWPEGTPILSLHIPSDALLSREALDASYQKAKNFFARFYPDFHYRGGWCHSWIISPLLDPLLGETSRIRTFQKDFLILEVEPESNAYKSWIFKDESLPLAQLPEDTSLQRRAKAHLLEGGKIGAAMGVLRPGLL